MSTRDAVAGSEEVGAITENTEFVYTVTHRAEEYRWPSDALIHRVRLDARFLHVEFVDGRNLSIPLSWIPTLREAQPEDREKFTISRDRRLIVWDPFETGTGINEIVRISDYFGPSTREKRLEEERSASLR